MLSHQHRMRSTLELVMIFSVMINRLAPNRNVSFDLFFHKKLLFVFWHLLTDAQLRFEIWKAPQEITTQRNTELETSPYTGYIFPKNCMSSWSKSQQKNIFCSHVKNYVPIKSQICACHDSSAVITLTNLGHDWIITIQIRAKRFFTRFQL